ncbi:hypothetical protein I41_12450 [Lacipirellula limnantheis]|uniref:Uncharacterized protein n=1 Tax=Lacipirellula limnantheis TaxID=2528024 RepID=A0A517TUN1_9BACT|nr:hypothetical protein I41_12450 [Lacipirellula limnantheis]
MQELARPLAKQGETIPTVSPITRLNIVLAWNANANANLIQITRIVREYPREKGLVIIDDGIGVFEMDLICMNDYSATCLSNTLFIHASDFVTKLVCVVAKRIS